MSIYTEKCGVDIIISDEQLQQMVVQTIEKSGKTSGKMLILPPDHTRLNSMAGRITEIVWEKYASSWTIDIMPALGTHAPMSDAELDLMFGKKIPKELFLVHDWRNDVVSLGKAPSSLLQELSEGKLDYEVDIQVNKRLFAGYDLTCYVIGLGAFI